MHMVINLINFHFPYAGYFSLALLRELIIVARWKLAKGVKWNDDFSHNVRRKLLIVTIYFFICHSTRKTLDLMMIEGGRKTSLLSYKFFFCEKLLVKLFSKMPKIKWHLFTINGKFLLSLLSRLINMEKFIIRSSGVHWIFSDLASCGVMEQLKNYFKYFSGISLLKYPNKKWMSFKIMTLDTGSSHCQMNYLLPSDIRLLNILLIVRRRHCEFIKLFSSQ